MNIVEDFEGLPRISEEEILSFLKKREGILDGVCITGGEPTLYKELPDFMERIKRLGFLVKLDTNGTNPEMLGILIRDGLTDYVAMDIKTSLNNYPQVAGISRVDTDRLRQSIDILLSERIPYEFRTTVVREYHTFKVFEEIGEMIRGCKNYYLQAFKDSEYVRLHTLTSYNKEELQGIAGQLEKYDVKAYVRGID